MGMGFGLYGGVPIFEILFVLMFVLVIGMFLVNAIKGIRQWNRNNHSPRLTVPATVVAKWTNVHHRRNHHGAGIRHSTTYYVTFQVESGDRMQMCVTGYEYGMLVEGDQGRLTFQGTRYLGFDRIQEEEK